jgi:transketolase
MVSACNGLVLSGLRPFGASFLVFTDYCRPPIRLAAMMKQPVILVFTHDSIGVGEDGPTHQPVEQLAALRAIPNLDVFRPGDANEAAFAWRHALARKDGPTLLALSRQDLPTWDRKTYAAAEGTLRGGYVLADSGKTPRILLIGTGSELQHCVVAYEKLRAEGVEARVVSMPCVDLFERQDAAYQAEVLPANVTARIVIEAGVAQGWEKYAGPRGKIIAQAGFGKSAPYNEVMEHFGFTADNVLATARQLLAEKG